MAGLDPAIWRSPGKPEDDASGRGGYASNGAESQLPDECALPLALPLAGFSPGSAGGENGLALGLLRGPP